MKVLHVVPTYLPATRYGGPIVSVHGLCRALALQGVEVDVATTSVDGPSNSDVPHNQPVCRDAVRVWYFPSVRLRRLYWSRDMAVWLRDNLHRYDVVHIHSVFLWPTLAACRLARRYGVPYVLAPRGMLVNELVEAKNTWLKRLWIALFDQQHVRRASALHVTSVIEQTELVKVVDHDVATWVIPNGVDEVESNQWRGSANSDRVVFIGRINWKKGLESLIQAVARGAAGHYIIAGNDEEGFAEVLQRLMRELGVEDRFEFPGPIHGEAKRALLRNSDVFVMPSLNENFGIAALEAMSEGCPTLVSRSCGIVSEVTEDSMRTTDTTPEQLADAINAMLGDEVLRHQLSKAGFEQARHLSWPAIAADMLRHYEGVVA
ncbi:MAG: glycosyltransferase involved in cell wall biosynthesis [Candidatus Azotimanducaceae bacterium]|jgi:glycosyltransferase involved in cell wall biosynthesis